MSPPLLRPAARLGAAATTAALLVLSGGAAHVTWEGAPDAFARLPEVRVGEVVTVGYDDGSTRSFRVTETAAVAKEDLARSLTVWGPHPRTPRLAIITCDPALGFGADGHTEANFVVIAEG